MQTIHSESEGTSTLAETQHLSILIVKEVVECAFKFNLLIQISFPACTSSMLSESDSNSEFRSELVGDHEPNMKILMTITLLVD